MDGYTPRRQDAPPGPIDSQWPLHRAARPAMGCLFEVYVVCDDASTALPVAEEALDEIQRLDRQLSHYRGDSDIARLNTYAGDEWVRVEPELFSLLRRCVEWTEATMGAFDISCGAMLDAWGFHTGSGRIADAGDIELSRAGSGVDRLILDESANLVHFAAPGMLLNLGAVGKGYGLDRAAVILRSYGIDNAVLHGGQSTILALGAGPAGQGWDFSIRDPADRSRPLKTLTLANAALSTSAIYNQYLEVGGMQYGHILNPATGRPADGPLSVSVTAPSAAESDAMATGIFVLGPEGARSVVARMPHLRAIVLERSEDGTTAVVEIGPP